MAPMISSWSMYYHCQWNYPLEFQVFCVVDVWVMWRPLPTVVLGDGGGDDDAGHLSLKKLVWWQCQYHLEILQMITYNYLFVFCEFCITHISCVAHYVHENIWNTDHQIGNYHNSHIPVCISDLAEAYAVAPCLTCRRFESFTTWRILFSIAFQFVDRYFWFIF